MKNTLTHSQEFALNVLKSGKNTFITGNAGTGKSYLLQKFIDYCEDKGKNYVVCAPTGTAAINVGGTTLHRTFSAEIGPIITKPNITEKSKIHLFDVVIIDEISMCRCDLFDWVVSSLQQSRRNPQIVVVGDFYQLPPVLTENEKEILTNYYPNLEEGWAFEGNEWAKCHFVTVCLTDIVRQKDQNYIHALDALKIGQKDSHKFFNKNCLDGKTEGIVLCGTNKEVSRINMDQVEKLNGEKFVCWTNIVGSVKDSDMVVDKVLVVKEGTRIMTVINDNNADQLYQNGSLGTVVDISDGLITVRMDYNGKEIQFGKCKFDIVEYKMNKETEKLEKEVVGYYRNYPLKVAYAITMHKSQGKTFDKCSINPYAFTSGQLYVALSRCTNLENLHLIKQIRPSYVKCSKQVKKFFEDVMNSGPVI